MSTRRRYNKHDSNKYYDWLDCAREDIDSAKILKDDEGCYQASAFHCQQTIEKALKAYILLKNSVPVDGHNLTWLCKRAMIYDKKFSQWLNESAALNKCYIETRYPTDMPLELDSERVESYYKMASEMYEFILSEVDKTIANGYVDPKKGKRSENCENI